MARHSRLVLLSGMLLFVLLVSLGHPMGVYADDGTPPPAATEDVQPPAEEETEVTPGEANGLSPIAEGGEQAVTEVPVATEALVVQETAATEVPVEEADDVLPIAEEEEESPEELTVSKVLEAAPEGTQVVVLDENGEALPLVSTEAAKIVAGSDPMWCPVIAGVPTPPGGAGCSPNFGTSQALIDNMDVIDPQTPGLGLYEQPGIIYFTADLTAPGNSFILLRGGLDDDVASPELYDADYDALKGYDLILQGGWSGVNGDTHFTQTDFGTNYVEIGEGTNPWVGNITIKDITISGVTIDTGLAVYTQGDITLSNVDVNHNTVGANLVSDGNIDIRSSTFGGGAGSGNDFLGLSITAAGGTTLFDVIASGNGLFGAILSSPVGFGGPITVSESHFDGNDGSGLLIVSGSSITLSNVTASDNGGVFFGLAGANLLGAGPITVTESHFDENAAGGLMVQSTSEVSLSGVTANGNGFFGAIVDAAGRVWVSNSYFDGNTDPLGEAVGLAIGSDQSITLDHVSASNNLIGDGVGLSTFENATIICSQFQNNAGVGVDGIAVDGAFTLNDVTFGGNGMDYDGTPVIMGGGCKVVVAGKGAGAKPSSHSLPPHIVPVSGGEQVELDCGAYSGTKLILPDGDQVTLPCPIKDQGVLTGKGQEQLPAPLNAGFAFASGLEVQVIRDGESVDETNAGMTIDFLIPDGLQDANLFILRWDEETAQWVEVPGVRTGDGRFLANSEFTGVYVLVTK